MPRTLTESRAMHALDSERASEVDKILSTLLETPGILGAQLIHKQRGLIRGVGAKHGDPATFTAIATTLIGGGDFLFDEAGQPGDVRVTLKTDRTRIHLSGVTEECLLATLADNRRDWALLRTQVNHARAALRAALRTDSGWSA